MLIVSNPKMKPPYGTTSARGNAYQRRRVAVRFKVLDDVGDVTVAT